MQRPPIEKLRHLALAVVLLLAGVSVLTYAVRAWRAHQARRSVPAVASDVRQQAEVFTFSRSEAGRTLFVIQASRTVERQGRKTVLEDVSVVVYGPEGNRADEIHTDRCEYDASGAGQIFCPDLVTFDLAATAPRAGSRVETERRLRIETARVRFDSESGRAQTNERVTFRFPEGYGQGVGLRYQPGQPAVVLEREVEVVLPRSGQPPLRIRGRSLTYNSRQRLLRLRPPLELVAGSRALAVGALALGLDSDYRVKRLEARGGVTARARPGGRRWQLRSEQATAEFSPGQGIERLRVSGQVEVESVDPHRERVLCQRAEIFFDASHRWVERVVAEGEARVRLTLPQERRELAAEKLELWLQPGGRAAERVVTHGRGMLAMTLASGEHRQIEADRIELEFNQQGRLTALAAQGAVEAVWGVPGQPVRRTASVEMRVEFSPDGELARAEQWGKFRFREEELEATAGRAWFEAERGVFVFTEQPTLWDATLRLSAERVELGQRDEHVAASGNVRTTYAGSGARRLLGSALPVHAVAEQMEGARSRPGRPGWTRYTERARLWQGANRLAADTIELQESPRQIVARGHVTSLLVERHSRARNPSARVLHITSERFSYREAEERGLYEGKVRGEGVFGKLQAERLEVFLTESRSGGGAEVERARALGSVVIEQSGRRAQAENAEYTVANETLVLWGGEPQLIDSQHGTTRGARLTFNLADDTILIEAGTGSRTVTRRTWTQ
ncbi:MAG: LptA/OstA family protein [Terriglobia bacterium]